VITRAGRRLAGRLVYDLDESEATGTLDAPSRGVNYTIFFSLIASIRLPDPEDRGVESATVLLQSGEELQIEAAGGLDERNAGMLIFVDGGERPEYLVWTDEEGERRAGPHGCAGPRPGLLPDRLPGSPLDPCAATRDFHDPCQFAV
jgi:hypothetical protein